MKLNKILFFALILIAIFTIGAVNASGDVNATDEILSEEDSADVNSIDGENPLSHDSSDIQSGVNDDGNTLKWKLSCLMMRMVMKTS